jgi:hypothetical protein
MLQRVWFPNQSSKRDFWPYVNTLVSSTKSIQPIKILPGTKGRRRLVLVVLLDNLL